MPPPPVPFYGHAAPNGSSWGQAPAWRGPPYPPSAPASAPASAPSPPVRPAQLQCPHPLLSPLGLVGFASVPVRHCFDSWGLVITHASGWSLAYTGDTLAPAPALYARAASAGSSAPASGHRHVGQGVPRAFPCAATASALPLVLVHEATFEPGMASRAALVRHSTTGQAAAAGALCGGAFAVLLTHFSQRSPKAVVLPRATGRGSGQEGAEGEWRKGLCGCACDGMVVPFEALPAVGRLQEAAERAYGAEAEPEEGLALPQAASGAALHAVGCGPAAAAARARLGSGKVQPISRPCEGVDEEEEEEAGGASYEDLLEEGR